MVVAGHKVLNVRYRIHTIFKIPKTTVKRSWMKIIINIIHSKL